MLNVFITCPKCGAHNCFYSIPATRADLALFRGSENPIVDCKFCQANMETMTAFTGERIGTRVLRHEDPQQ